MKLFSGIEPCQDCKVTKFQVDTILTCHTMDGQIHSIGKAKRPLFVDPVTIISEIVSISPPAEVLALHIYSPASSGTLLTISKMRLLHID